MAKKLRIDWFLFAIAASLALFGAIMVYSASAMIALRETGGESQMTYFYKQFGFTLAGLAVMFLMSKINYRWYQNEYVVYGILAVTVLLLLSVFGFPPINGARRWIRFPGFSFQPSEIAKIALPIFLAYFLTKNEEIIGDLKETVLPCLLVLGGLGALIMLEPDLGTTIVLCAIFVTVYFAAGAKILHLAAVGGSLLFIGVCALDFCAVANGAFDGVSRSVCTFRRCRLSGRAGTLRHRFGRHFRRRFCQRSAETFLFAVSVFGFYFRRRR